MYIIPLKGVVGEEITGNEVLNHLIKAKGDPQIMLDIDSVGGDVDEGIKIRNYILNSGKEIFVQNSGDVCSIAVSFFLCAPIQNRIFNPARGMFLIHNPWIAGFEGGSEDLVIAAKELKAIENQLAKDYNQATGTDIDIIKNFMANDAPLTPDQIKTLGFATIAEPIKAIAKLNNKKMEINEKLNVFEKTLNKIMAKLNINAKYVANDVNNVELVFPDISSAEEIAVGVAVTVGGTAATGESVMADGSTVKYEAGKVIEIIPAMEENPLETENAALKQQIAELTAKNEATNVELENAKTEFVNIKNEFHKFKSQFKVEPQGKAAPETKPVSKRR